MRPAPARAAALAALVAAGLTAPARAQPERRQAFLPALAAPGIEVLPCRPDAAGACPVAPGWRLVCGGFGALRDLYAEPDGAAANAIGDGVARLRIAAPPGTRPAPGDWWFQGQLLPADPDFDRVLTGLRGVGLDACRAGDPGCVPGAAWGVGDRPWIAHFDGTCWRPDAPLLLADGRRAGEGEARLASMVPTFGGGLAVGERDGAATHAERVGLGGAGRAWRLAPDDAGRDLPPLDDVDVVGGPLDGEAWAVGRDGTVARRRLSDGVWSRAARLAEGSARELTMLDAREGWAFGMSRGPGDLATIAWRFDGTAWREETRYPGQSLVDAYKAGPDTLLLGLSPGRPGVPVLHLRSTVGWRAVAPDPPGARGGYGHRAIAPLADGRVLYAAGSDVWLHDASAGWTLLRRRMDLRAFVPEGGGGWALAATATGSRVLRALAGGRLVDPDPAALDLPPLRALAGEGGELWAVGAGGATWRRRPESGAWEAVGASEKSADLVDVARDDTGGIWAAAQASGRGRLLRWDDEVGGWQPVAEADAPLRAVAGLPGGGAVAVGGRLVVAMQPAERCVDGEGAEVVAGGRSWCATTLEPCFAGTCLDGLGAVATAPDGLWIANGTYVLRQRAGGLLSRWREQDWHARDAIPTVAGALKPFEASIVALAVSGRDDGWAVFACCARRDPPGRETSYAVRFDGSGWSEAVALAVPVRDAALSADGDLWLAGDWTTLATRPRR